MKLEEIVQFLDDFLAIKEWEDKSNNGLQVEGKQDVRKIVFAVDACMDVFAEAKKRNADMIVVHHGLIWGGIDYVRGMAKKRLKFALPRPNMIQLRKEFAQGMRNPKLFNWCKTLLR